MNNKSILYKLASPAAIAAFNPILNKQVNLPTTYDLDILRKELPELYDMYNKGLLRLLPSVYTTRYMKVLPEGVYPRVNFKFTGSPADYMNYFMNPNNDPRVAKNLLLIDRQAQRARHEAQGLPFYLNNGGVRLGIDYKTIHPDLPVTQSLFPKKLSSLLSYIDLVTKHTDPKKPLYAGYNNNNSYSFVAMNSDGIAGVAPRYRTPGLLTKGDKELKRHLGAPGNGHLLTSGNLAAGTLAGINVFNQAYGGVKGQKLQSKSLIGSLLLYLGSFGLYNPTNKYVSGQNQPHSYLNSLVLATRFWRNFKLSTAQSNTPVTRIKFNYGTDKYNPGNNDVGFDAQLYLKQSYTWDPNDKQWYRNKDKPAINTHDMYYMPATFVQSINRIYYLQNLIQAGKATKADINLYIRSRTIFLNGFLQAQNKQNKNYMYG